LLKFFLIIIVLIGCDKDEAGDNTTGSSALNGTWARECSSNPVGQTSSREFRIMDGSSMTYIYRGYEDLECSNKIFSYQSEYSISISGENFDIHSFSSYKLSISDENYLVSANGSAFCGSSDWQLSIARDIGGKTCRWTHTDSESSSSIAGREAFNGPTIYGSAKLVEGSLWFAAGDDDNDGSSSVKRASTYENSPLYIWYKQ